MKTTLIEQAAKRLEELKRAGVESAEAAPPVAPPPVAQPSPEAMVLALEGRTHGSSALVRGERKQEPRVDRADADIRHIDINFAQAQGARIRHARCRLVADRRGIPRHQAADHPQRASAAARVKHGNLVMVTSALPGGRQDVHVAQPRAQHCDRDRQHRAARRRRRRASVDPGDASARRTGRACSTC